MIGPYKPYHHIRITRGVREDMNMWLEFLENFNGIVFLLRVSGVLQKLSNYLLIAQVQITWAVVAIFRNNGPTTNGYQPGISPHSKRYYILRACTNSFGINDMGVRLHSKQIILHIDNISLVHILNNQSSKSPRGMSLIRPIMLMTLWNNIQFNTSKVEQISLLMQFLVNSGMCSGEKPPMRTSNTAIPTRFQTMLSTMK